MSRPLSQPAGNETAQRPLLARAVADHRPRRASAEDATIGDLIENPWIPVGHFGGSGGGLDEMGRFDMAYLSYLRQHNQAVLICINGGGRRATQRRANGTSAITPQGMTWQSWSEFQFVRAERTIVHCSKIVTCR